MLFAVTTVVWTGRAASRRMFVIICEPMMDMPASTWLRVIVRMLGYKLHASVRSEHH